MCVNLGRNNQAVIESIVEQARTLPYAAAYATTLAPNSAACCSKFFPKIR